MTIHPLGSRVLIRPLEAASKTPGGIELPDMAKDKSTRGTVLSLGHDAGRIYARHETLQAGDVVEYGRYAGTPTTGVEGETLLLVDASDLYAVVKE